MKSVSRVYCKVHRQKELPLHFKNAVPFDGTCFIEPCELCIAVAMVKAKRRMRKNLEGFLDKSILEEGR